MSLVGLGLIGSGWAAEFLAQGLDVVATDPDAAAGDRARTAIAAAWPVLEERGLARGATPDRFAFEPQLEACVANADFVQESAPEAEPLKIELLARIDAATSPDVVIATSSSGLLPTRLQRACAHPERVLVGHPFNPVYLLPLVEVLGGDRTDEGAIEWALEFYSRVGKSPLRVRREIEGYIADRLQEALWREALHLVADGIATTEEIDAAIMHGPGLRLAIMGPCLAFHLAGGTGGMRHMLDQFGPALELPWTKLQAPELTDELRARMIEGTRAQASGAAIADLERERDRCLLEILAVLRQHRRLV